MDSETRYLVGLSLLPGIGPIRFGRLLERCGGDPERAFRAPQETLLRLGLDSGAIRTLTDARETLKLDREMARLDDLGVRVLTAGDAEYPTRLREIPVPPALLYVKGNLGGDDLSVGVVGTRSPSVYGKELAARVTPQLVGAGLTVVSGLARGVDAIAHRAALDAGGRTIAVLGCGIDVVYPAENRPLFARIPTSGAIVTEYPLGTKPDAFNFPARNRIISGLTLGTVVIEAQIGSGALITADYALEQGREVFAFPGRATDRGSSGCNRLIREGRAKLVTGIEDILDELDLTVAVRQLELGAAIPASDDEGKLLALLSHDPVHIDDLSRRSGLAPPVVAGTLTMLELRGAVRQIGSMSFVLAR